MHIYELEFEIFRQINCPRESFQELARLHAWICIHRSSSATKVWKGCCGVVGRVHRVVSEKHVGCRESRYIHKFMPDSRFFCIKPRLDEWNYSYKKPTRNQRNLGLCIFFLFHTRIPCVLRIHIKVDWFSINVNSDDQFKRCLRRIIFSWEAVLSTFTITSPKSAYKRLKQTLRWLFKAYSEVFAKLSVH